MVDCLRKSVGFPGGVSLFSCIYQALIVSLPTPSRQRVEITLSALKTIIRQEPDKPNASRHLKDRTLWGMIWILVLMNNTLKPRKQLQEDASLHRTNDSTRQCRNTVMPKSRAYSITRPRPKRLSFITNDQLPVREFVCS